MVVAQLVEQSFPTPKVRGSNLIIGKLLYLAFICLLSTQMKRQKNEKVAGNGRFKKSFNVNLFIVAVYFIIKEPEFKGKQDLKD